MSNYFADWFADSFGYWWGTLSVTVITPTARTFIVSADDRTYEVQGR